SALWRRLRPKARAIRSRSSNEFCSIPAVKETEMAQQPNLPTRRREPYPSERNAADEQELEDLETKKGEAITLLLSHYWTALEDDKLRAAQVDNWLTDLEPWPLETLEAALTEWRQSNRRKPTPADIRALCVALQPPPKAKPYAPEWLMEAQKKGWLPMPTDENLIRPNWNDIPAPYLTKAEHRLGAAKVSEILKRAKRAA